MQIRDQFSAQGQVDRYASMSRLVIPNGRWWPQLMRPTLAGLLSVHLAAVVGCGALGGLSGAHAPLAQHVAPPNTAAPIATQAAKSTATHPVAVVNQMPRTSAVVAASYQSDMLDPAASESDVAYGGNSVDPSQYGPACSEPAHSGGQCSCCTPAPANAYRNVQEYIFDGGDQQPTAVVKQDWSTVGVDPTDTVIHYETLAGTVCIHPSNRVPIYAPRFGAVRQVSGLQLSMRAVGTERILAPLAAERFDEKNLAAAVVLPVAPHGEQQVGLIDAFQENYVGTPLDQVQPLSRMSTARVPFELVDPRRTGLITRQELIDIRQLIQNAQTWVNPESLTVEISNQPALLVKDTKAPQDLVLYESPDKCAMRICKAASHTIANSGDIVSFAIRFDNAGIKPLGNVVITDSLAPRLNYIQGSQQCSVGVRFSAEPNDVGSMILRWEIEEPVQPGDGGVVSFDCQVR